MNEEKIKSIKNSPPIAKADFVLFAIVLVAIVFSIVMATGSKGNFVEITYNGKVTSYQLAVDRTITVREHFVVVIRDGEVWVEETDCPGRQCANDGKISRTGEVLLCAHHNIFIKITSDSGYDGGLLGNSGA